MTLVEIKAVAKKQKVTIGKLKKAELIQAIQIAEGNTPCFKGSFSQECAVEDCLWRGDCIAK